MIRRRIAIPHVIPWLLLVLLALAIPQAASASTTVAPIHVGQPAGKVLDYWTKARMRAAEPVPTQLAGQPQPTHASAERAGAPSYVPPAAPGSDGDPELLQGTATGGSVTAPREAALVADPTAPKIRAHGKVFFTTPKGPGKGNFVCSGTAVNSRNRSLVITAGHCVFDHWYDKDGDLRWSKSTHFMFVPGYQNGNEPFGAWPATELASTKQWKRKENFRYDVAGAIVSENSSGQSLQDVVGARGIGFDQPRDQTYDIFGYPILGAFVNSLDEYECLSGYEGSDSAGVNGPAPMKISCDMTGGASGGGWIIGDKTLVSVTSYSRLGESGALYGPYLSNTAKQLYKSMRGK